MCVIPGIAYMSDSKRYGIQILHGADMIDFRDEHTHVTLSKESLRRVEMDAALLRRTQARNTVLVWAATVAMGILMGWVAAEGLAQ